MTTSPNVHDFVYTADDRFVGQVLETRDDGFVVEDLTSSAYGHPDPFFFRNDTQWDREEVDEIHLTHTRGHLLGQGIRLSSVDSGED